ncbi:MAG: hypothetical protein ABI699_04695 [Caldimonas sp.]
MEHYVTLFDSLFLPQALALHASFQRNAGAYRLWMLCVDVESFDVLQRLQLPNCNLMRLADHETPALLAAKATRSRGEYCWTLTPHSPRFVFDSDPTVDRVTYVDADMWLRRDPRPIFREFEMSKAAVLITDHAYAPEYDQSATSGRYCVQFMVFNRQGSETVRRWWEDRCIEWCYARFEDGKFGDQKYLDDWTTRFDAAVHVLRQQELLLAPWNAIRFPYGPAIAYHFHGLRLLPGRRLDAAAGYALPEPVLRYVYAPYVAELRTALAVLERAGFSPRPQAKAPSLYEVIRRATSSALRPSLRRHRWNMFRL